MSSSNELKRIVEKFVGLKWLFFIEHAITDEPRFYQNHINHFKRKEFFQTKKNHFHVYCLMACIWSPYIFPRETTFFFYILLHNSSYIVHETKLSVLYAPNFFLCFLPFIYVSRYFSPSFHWFCSLLFHDYQF